MASARFLAETRPALIIVGDTGDVAGRIERLDTNRPIDIVTDPGGSLFRYFGVSRVPKVMRFPAGPLLTDVR